MLYDAIQEQLFIRSAVDTANTFTTETHCRKYLDLAHKWAAAYKKWPFTEYKDKSGAYVVGTEEYAYPNTGFKTDSIRILKIGDVMFEKKIFKDYLQFREDYSSDDEEIFSDYGRTLYINPNYATAGTIYCYGQLTPATLGLVGSSASSTVFSNYDEEGDDAIIDKACGYIFRRMRKFQEAIDYENRARLTLEEIWKRIQDEQALYQTKDRPIWERFDVIDGENENENPLEF